MAFLCLIVGMSVGPCAARSDSFEPWGFDNRPVSINASQSMPDTSEHQKNISLSSRLAVGGLNLFSEYISRVDGDRCPMYPTCSAYSRQAMRKHGFIMGIIMTADRLIHEGNEMDYAPLIRAGESVRYYDPVSWNDYWWYGKEALDK